MSEPEQRVKRVLEQTGTLGALAEALEGAGLSALPEQPDSLAAFVRGPLGHALVGRVHPSTADEIVDAILEEIPGRTQPITARPPADDASARQAYEDLISGAIHTRATPAWGLRKGGTDPGAQEALWILVTVDRTMVEMAMAAAPQGTEVIAVTSMAVLKGALSRGEQPASAVVLDARSPSIPVDRTVAVLAEGTSGVRVVVWRMPLAERQRLNEAVPHTQTWLPCGDEVSPAEIVQLLGA
ncbi:MAG: hypothetical protein VYE22_13195 [Myxococcota bacterium]|nr:hypothetical protein [Myxococcota bacterium]